MATGDKREHEGLRRGSPWFKCWPLGWLRACRFFTPEQTGYFFRLHMESWDQDPPCSLPDDPDVLWRLAGAHSRKRFEATAGIVIEAFERRDGRLWSPTLLALDHERQAIAAERQVAGKRGAASRWQTGSKAMANAIPKPKQTHGEEEGEEHERREEKPSCAPGVAPAACPTPDSAGTKPEKEADPRHRPIVEAYAQEFTRRHADLKPPLDGSDAKALQRLLRQQAGATVEQITGWLTNAFNSDPDAPPLRAGFRLREFCAHATKYLNGPLKRGNNGKRSTGGAYHSGEPGKYDHIKPDFTVVVS
jgi:hypothetical protein